MSNNASLLLLAVTGFTRIVDAFCANQIHSPISPTIAARTARRCSRPGAKKEGKLIWYTSLTAHRDIANVFEAKYPGIKVETYRAGPNDLTRRLLTEAQSKRSIADLIETTPATLMIMRESKLLMPYFSPHLAKFPDDAKEEADKGRVFWTTDRESIVGLGYNRNLIRAADVPKNFAELVKPENKGKIAVSGDTTGVRFIGAMIAAKGEEFVKQLRSAGRQDAHDLRRRDA